MKILVTGADGFIGSHLTESLVRHGHDVRAFVFYNSFNSWGWLESFPAEKLSGIEVFSGDIRDPNGVRTAMSGCDIVFHLAAYNHVGDSFKHVFENVNSNLLSTVNLLNHGPKIKKLIHMGTSEIYGIQKVLPFNTNEKANPMSPYGVTKYASELFSLLKSKSSNLNLLCVRPFNTFGPFQSEKAIIPEMIIKCLQNKEIKKVGEPRKFNFIPLSHDILGVNLKQIDFETQ